MLVKLISYCYNRYEAEKAKKKKTVCLYPLLVFQLCEKNRMATPKVAPILLKNEKPEAS